MNISLNFIRETELARLYSDKEGQPFWIPRSVVKSTTKFPAKPGETPVHTLNIEDWWWDKHEGENDHL